MSVHNKTRGLVLVLSLVLSAAVVGQSPSGNANAAPAKVGIVAIQQAIAATNEGKKALDALQQRFTPKQTELKGLNDEIEGMKKQLQTQGDKLSEDARGTLARNIETKQKTLQRNVEDAQAEYQQAQQEIFNTVGGKMAKVLETYAVKNGYGVILDVSNPQTPVLYASESTNITKEIVDAYNAQSPGVGSAPKATGAAPKPKAPGAASTAAKTGATSSKP
ncbi:MAG TPA: OmpH family outer membrane protein [Candidatus Angelobacter sp.]|nr:OmpH family outer membrane protein [Candidatus Angelobacter sp.]